MTRSRHSATNTSPRVKHTFLSFTTILRSLGMQLFSRESDEFGRVDRARECSSLALKFQPVLRTLRPVVADVRVPKVRATSIGPGNAVETRATRQISIRSQIREPVLGALSRRRGAIHRRDLDIQPFVYQHRFTRRRRRQDYDPLKKSREHGTPDNASTLLVGTPSTCTSVISPDDEFRNRFVLHKCHSSDASYKL